MKSRPTLLDQPSIGDSADWEDQPNQSWSFSAPPIITAAGSSLISATASTTQILYLQEPGDYTLISVNDINQGQIGDCYLLASIGELAFYNPAAITNMIHVNADGTETVTLYLAASGSLPGYGTTAFRATTVTVTNTFPSNAVNNGATQDVYNGQKEIWAQVVEKAVATLGGGYNSIANGGNPMIALEELTGQTATSLSPGSLTVQSLQGYITAGDLIVMDTPSSGSLPYGLFNNHAYMFESLTTVSGIPMVQLRNPWGFDQPTAIPLSLLSRGIVEVDIGHAPITGGPGATSLTLDAAVTNASIILATGCVTISFANGTNSATVSNAETIIGGTGDDTVTLGSATVAASTDLGAGRDTLTFGNFANSATVSGVETIVGGAGADTCF